MRNIFFIIIFVGLFNNLNCQVLNVKIVNKKIDSVLKKQAFLDFRTMKTTVCYDFDFVTLKYKSSGTRKYVLYKDNKGAIKKIEWKDVKVNKTILNISFYPSFFAKEYIVYTISIYNCNVESTTLNKGFILVNRKDNSIYHLSYFSPIDGGVKPGNYIEGISKLDSNLYSTKYVTFLPNEYKIKSSGYLLFGSDHFITFHANAEKDNRIFNGNLNEISNLFFFNKNLYSVKVNRYSENTKTPYFQPYFLYGYSLLDYKKY